MALDLAITWTYGKSKLSTTQQRMTVPTILNRRATRIIRPKAQIGGNLAPAIIVKSLESLSNYQTIQAVCRTQTKLKDSPFEAFKKIGSSEDLIAFIGLHSPSQRGTILYSGDQY